MLIFEWFGRQDKHTLESLKQIQHLDIPHIYLY